MAAKLTPIGSFGKWVIVPAAFLLFGYFAVGPRLGRVVPIPPKPDQTSMNSAPPATDGGTNLPSSDQDRHVSVQPEDTTQVAERRPAHRKHRKPARPAEDSPSGEGRQQPAATAPASDQGGSAGSTTAG